MSCIKTKTGEKTITFDAFYQYIWARNYGDTDVYISNHSDIVVGDDDVALLPAGEAVRLTVNGKTLYVLGSTTLEVHAQNFSDSPFAWNEAGEGGGSDITVESLSVDENGTYTAPSGTAYSPVTVSVSDIPAVIETLTVTENGTYIAPSGVDGYSPVTVDTGIYVGTDNPSASLGKNGDYYYKRAHGMKTATTISAGIVPNQGNQYCGMIFSSATPITISGFRSFLKYNAGSVQYQLIDADTGTAVITTDTITYDTWDDWGNIVMLATPFTTTANKTYYVVANLGNPRGTYVSKSSVSSDIITISGSVSRGSIYVDWTVDSNTVYLVDILTETSYYTITNQYYKETGSWVEIGT